MLLEAREEEGRSHTHTHTIRRSLPQPRTHAAQEPRSRAGTGVPAQGQRLGQAGSGAWGPGCRWSPTSPACSVFSPLLAPGSSAGQLYLLGGFICTHFGTNGSLPCLYHRINRDFPDQRPPQARRRSTEFSQLRPRLSFGRHARAAPSTWSSLVTVWKRIKPHTHRGKRLPARRINQEPSWEGSELTAATHGQHTTSTLLARGQSRQPRGWY